MIRNPAALDFFAGSGLVTLGLQPYFDISWANDICDNKAAIYIANFGRSHFHHGSIEQVKGKELPCASLSWASFPCQDLSLAGNMIGMAEGSRSGLFWQWLRVHDEMNEPPPVVCLENVVGFLVADGGKHFRDAYKALRERGYLCGAFVVDAVSFVPQSRPRSFLVGVQEGVGVDGLSGALPMDDYCTRSVYTAYNAVVDREWIWWKMPCLPRREKTFSDLFEKGVPVHSEVDTAALLSMLSPINKKKLSEARKAGSLMVGTGYKRTRIEVNRKYQRLEIRFDGIAGCLRSPNGGSSRQIVLIVEDRKVSTRLMTVRETARLMGVDDSYRIPGSYNDGYRAMGDAVAVPVTTWLAKHLLYPLADRAASLSSIEIGKAG